MLFHCTHTHAPEACPGNDPQRLGETFGKMPGLAEQLGITMLGAYLDAPAHRLYFIFDTDAVEKVRQILEPTFPLGVTEVRPVLDARAELQRRTQS